MMLLIHNNRCIVFCVDVPVLYWYYMFISIHNNYIWYPQKFTYVSCN